MSWFKEITNKAVGRAVGLGVKTATNAISYIANPALARLESAGLRLGGLRLGSTNIGSQDINFSGSPGTGRDWRVKVSCPVLGYGGVMAPLGTVGGVIFPHTPQISVTHQANYSAQRYTHSNYPHYAYENSEVQNIQITAEMTVQTADEAAYVLGCIYFFRASTKMFFANSSNAGNPPPLVYLDGYGDHYFPHVPCVVTQFNHTMPADVDYVSSGATRVPTISQFSIQLQPVYSKRNIADNFSLDGFAAGQLTDRGFL
jgi:hypothetical protein